MDGRIVSGNAAGVSVHAHVLSYGTGVFDGIRAWWNEQHAQLYLFDAEAHYDRLARSARIMGLPLSMSGAELVSATAELLRKNDIRSDAYVRPMLLQSGECLPVRMHDVATHLYVTVTPMPGDYIDPDGIRCMVSTWRRAPDIATPNRAKVVGTYTGPALAKTEAVRLGFDEAIMLTLDGHVAEATTSNILMRVGGTWATPPDTDDILAGITRAQLIRLLQDDGADVVQRRIDRSELYVCDELLLCGTAAVVVPVVEVDGRLIGTGKPGDTTLRLNHTLRAVARRDSDRYPDWTIPVYGEERQADERL